MLELVVVACLCWRNGRIARKAGHSQRSYWLITLGLLFAGYVVGVIVGSIMIDWAHAPIWATYVCGWGGVILGGAGSYVIANRAARTPVLLFDSPWDPTHWSPEDALDVTDAADSKGPVVGSIPGRRLILVDEWVGDRAHIVTADGQQGWVDGAGLVAFRSERGDVWESPTAPDEPQTED
ncbi:MAG TPA: SH3 domain-containing protein [Candidatus Limnocylindrales bacterium]